MLNDLRIVLRQARQTPGFVVAAVLTLALGIGANTSIFSLVSAFMRPLPVPDAEQIVVLANAHADDETGLRYKFSFAALQDYRARASSVFSDVFGYDIRIGGLGVNGKTTGFVYQVVTGNLFSALRLTPAAGRLFAPGEGEHAGSEASVVLGHAYWMRRFGGDPAIVGTIVKFDGFPTRVIGVAPAGFKGMVDAAEMDGYITIDASPRSGRSADQIFVDRNIRTFVVAARLQPGVTLAKARAVVDVVAGQIAAEHPQTEKGTSTRVVPEPEARPIPLASLTALLPVVRLLTFVLSSVVLLIACMNVANLLLVRATVREREMAVRASLGAGRLRLIRLLLVESMLLAVLGATAGLAIGYAMNWIFIGSIDLGTDVGFSFDPRFDWNVFVNAGIVTIVAGLAIGVLPARKASRASVTSLLHDGGRSGSAGAGRARVRQALVVAQVAGSLVLLIVAGLCVRNLRIAQQVDLGFSPDRIVTARLNTLDIGMDLERTTAFYEELHRRLRLIPGVESASLSFSLPLGWIFGGYEARAEGSPPVDGGPPAIGTNSVSPEYFDTMGIPIVGGRAFDSNDTRDSKRVVIVNETLAERFWPDQTAIGKRIEIPSLPGDLWEVVGVARASKYLAVFEHPLPYIYMPFAQNPGFLRVVEVRSNAPLAETAMRLERTVAALEPELPIADVRPMKEIVAGNLGFVLFRVGAWQAGALGVLGLLLAVIGVYAVVSYQTSQRGREIGIRMALGAQAGDVRALVLRQGVWLVLIGVGIGLALTLTLTTALDKVLVLVDTTDPGTIAMVTAMLALFALAACYIPASRATRIQPVDALRHE
jgi:predicted permease